MHIRYQHAAVDVTPEQPQSVSSDRRPGPPARVLWASRWLAVRSGRLVGVRVHANALDAALITHGAAGIRWVDAETVMTESQARLWLRTSRFRAVRGR
jgi:hypothetical protein